MLMMLLLISWQVLAQPLVIAHRGASGYLPEHTLEAAVLAYMQEADYVEQDLVLTKDAQLIVLHDIHLDTTTDVALKFPKRKREDGRYYAIDFTLAEIKQLNKFERISLPDNKRVYPQRYAGTQGFQISTWAEHVQLIQELNRQLGRDIGLYPELKAPAWHQSQGYDILDVFVTTLNAQQLNQREAKIIVQCFDWDATQALRQQHGLKTRLVQLIAENAWQESSTDYDYLQSAQGIAAMAQVVDGVGPWLPQLYDRQSQQPTAFWQRLQQSNLSIHAYTHRDDALVLTDDVAKQHHILFNLLGLDGIFTDHPDTTRQFLSHSID
jgi:glycerophosphoryl diester phosphodiesterase